MYNIFYNKDEDVIFAKRHGDITVPDIISYIIEIEHKFGYKDKILVLEDYRFGVTKYDMDDYPVIVDELKKRIGDRMVKTAVLVDSPSDTALSMIFGYISEQIVNYSFKTFSTERAAIQWLKL